MAGVPVKRAFIVALVIFALLYLGALAVGFRMNADQSTSVSAIEDSWLSGAKGWLAGLGPRLDLTGLRCDGLPADRVITLTEAKPSCIMTIPKASDKGPEYRKTSVGVLGAGANIYILARFDKEHFPPERRDPTCFLDGTVPPGLKLKLEYEPNGKQKGAMWSCWLRKRPDETADLVAMKDGGTLTLTCEGCCDRCDPSGPRALRLSLE